MIEPVVSETLRLALALLFGAAAFHKARDPGAFRKALEAYQLLPRRAVATAALALVGSEAVLTLLLVWPATQRAGAIGAAGLLLVYSGSIAINLVRGRREIDCGCGGVAGSRTLGPGLLMRNALLVSAAVLAALSVQPRPLIGFDRITIAFAVATLALAWNAGSLLAASPPQLARRRLSG